MPLIFVEDAREFQTRHGGDVFAGQKVQIGPGHFLFSDGASIHQGGLNNAPVYVDPPTTSANVLSLRRKYHSHRAVLFEQAFHALKNSLMGAGVSFSWHEDFGPDPGDPRLALLQLRALAADQRRKLAALDKEIFDLPENVAKRKYDAEQLAWRQAEEAKRAQFVSEVQAINLETIQPETIQHQP